MATHTQLDRALRAQADAALAAHGFALEHRYTFRRLADDGASCQIVHIERGNRSRAGCFTVDLACFAAGDTPGTTPRNAGVADCRFERRVRIGVLMPLRWPRLAALPFVGFLFGTVDRWWPCPESDETRTRASVAAAVQATLDHGLPWLDQQKHLQN